MKKLIIPCECVGGEKYCGRMEIWPDYDLSGDLEINFFERKKKKTDYGVWISGKTVKKIIKFLEKV